MAFRLSRDARLALQDPLSVKVLGSIGPGGVPHLAFKDSLRLRPDGDVQYDELIETSQAGKNMTYAVWFGKPVALAVLTPDRRSFLLHGTVLRNIMSGREFRAAYLAVRAKPGDFDLASVWIIRLHAEREDTLQKRKEEEEALHPLLRHVDRLL
jgi:hypothetical protein